jgi:undecaprenyl diphosphate synthase
MDGNGRWARKQGLPRIRGHEAGARTVREIVIHCARRKMEALTLFSFSTENWKRPPDEVEFLMGLYAQYLVAERDTILNNNVRFLHVGRRAGLCGNVLHEMDTTIAMSRANTGLKLCLALNYGSRDEIVDAVRIIAEKVQDGRIRVGDIDEAAISNELYTAGLPDPDLLIRTAGERRISNFLLWQISYAELYISGKNWPEFTPADLDAAIDDFAGRERRYGGVQEDAPDGRPHV